MRRGGVEAEAETARQRMAEVWAGKRKESANCMDTDVAPRGIRGGKKTVNPCRMRS